MVHIPLLQLKDYINQKRSESIISQAVQTLLKEADVKIIKTFKMDKVAESSNTAEQPAA